VKIYRRLHKSDIIIVSWGDILALILMKTLKKNGIELKISLDDEDYP
jgi:hypothetical protein